MTRLSTDVAPNGSGDETIIVYLDGVPVLTVDTYGDPQTYQATVGTWTEDGEWLEIATAPVGDLEPALTLKEELLS